MRTSGRLRNLLSHLRRVATDERLRFASLTYGQLDYPRAAIYLRLTSREEFHRLKSCQKEPWTVRWLEEYLEPGQVLYDVGANIGAYTLLAATVQRDSRVVAFEPSPANFAGLCANLELNEVADRVTPVPLALGERPHGARLTQGADVAGASPSVRPEGAGAGPGVLVDRLDDVVERFGLPGPNHVKLDVDGGELEVLAGGERTLAAERLRSLMVELDREREDEVLDRLSAYGFQLLERPTGPDRGASLPTYGLFARQ